MAITVNNYQESDEIDRISAIIYCEQKSQKGILIGKGGTLLKKIGTEARLELEKIVDKKTIQVLRMLYFVDISKISKISLSEETKKVTNFFFFRFIYVRI